MAVTRASGDTAPISLERRGPVTVVTYHHGATDEQYEQYLEALGTMLLEDAEKYPRLGQVHDASEWMRSTPRQRQMQADWLKRHMAVLRARGGYSAFVFKSALVRGGLTAVMWLVSMPGPHKIFATRSEALAWIEPQVRGDG